MKNLKTVITWIQAIAAFLDHHAPAIVTEEQKHGYSAYADLPMRREAWNNYVDSLCKDGQISDWQQANWSHPTFCDGYGCNSA